MKYKQEKNVKLLAFSFFLSLIIFVILFFIKNLFVKKDFYFSIENGDNLNTTIKKLYNKGVINSFFFVKLYAKISRNTFFSCEKIHIGDYFIKKGDNINSVLDKICNGKSIMITFTIPEGLYTQQIIDNINNNKDLVGEKISFNTEGVLMPETYTFRKGFTKKEFLEKMIYDMDIFLTNEWENRDKNVNLKSKYEALILASIVEAEAKTDDERAIIASVYFNRLKIRMRLQADPTTIYEITKGKYKMTRLLTLEDLKLKGRWNTYRKYGLPDTPICNPGKKSIQAVLHPKETEYLYFIAKKDLSGHLFAKDYNEHLKLKKSIKKR